MKIRGGFLDGQILSAAQIEQIASLPPKDVLIAQLMGQVQAPITGLVYVLNGLLAGLARVLQAHADNLGQQSGAPEEATATSEQ